MGMRRESGGGCGQKRVVGIWLPVPAAYTTPKFTTLSAAKKGGKQQRKQKVDAKIPHKNRGFTVSDLFLTDG